jgi:N-acetyl-alpha-D-muramate 1-phosphate uridylyltransferase
MTGENGHTGIRAMILAAGLGTRLKPLTDTRPKALIEINGRTLLEMAIEHLAEYGIREIIVNVHHFGGLIIGYLKKYKNFGLQITISDETGELLETGGGVKKAASFFPSGRPFIVRNADVISDLDLGKMIDFHLQVNALATLAVRQRVTSRYFLFTGSGELAGWTDTNSGKEIRARDANENLRMLAFSGIQVIDPGIFGLTTETGKFSLTDLYLRLARTERIVCWEDNESKWKDVGKSLTDLNFD